MNTFNKSGKTRPRKAVIKTTELLLATFLIASTALAQSPKKASARPATVPNFQSRAPNDCLPAAMRVYHELPGPPTCSWKRILSARYADGRMHHVYCVFSLGSKIYAYDTNFGSRRVFPLDKSLASVVRAVDFQATYGVYLDQEEKPKIMVASNQKAGSKKNTVKETAEAGKPRVAAAKATGKQRN